MTLEALAKLSGDDFIACYFVLYSNGIESPLRTMRGIRLSSKEYQCGLFRGVSFPPSLPRGLNPFILHAGLVVK